jgi:hypothetical protein
VISGKKTEDEIVMDWLDTFEQHHALEVIIKKKILNFKSGDQKGRDHIVTAQEFNDYYNNVSCSIDDDPYFELMIRNAWNLDNKGPAKKA